MFSITSRRRNANQNCIQLYLTKIRMAITKGSKIHGSKSIKCGQECGRNRIFKHFRNVN